LPISFYYKKIARLQYVNQNVNQKEQNPRNCLPRSGFVQQAHAVDGKKHRSFVALLFATTDARRYVLKK